LALRDFERAAPRVALAALGTLVLHIALAAPGSADPLDSVKESIRLKRFSGAASELQRLAAAGNSDAQYLLAVFYLGPIEPWVERYRIELDLYFFIFVRRLRRGQHSFLESPDLGLESVFPVISVIADRDDGRRSRHISLAQPQHILEPVECRDRTRLTT